MPLPIDDLTPLLGLQPSDPAISAFLNRLSSSPSPDVKTYPDSTYHNYYTLGLSLCFISNTLDSVDIFNPQASSSKSKNSSKAKYSPPPLPLVFEFATGEVILPPRKEGDAETRYPRDQRLEVTSTTVGRELVRAFGEPSRKGSGGRVGVWLEWVVELKKARVGVMLELEEKVEAGQKEAGGVWDRAATWPWGSIKVFRPDAKSGAK